MMRKPYVNPNRADMVRAFERLVEVPASLDKDYVNKVPTELALYILDLAKRAPWPRGKRVEPTRPKVISEALVMWRARRRKQQLMKTEHIKADDAALQAAKEVKAATGCKLSVTTIADRIKRRQAKRKRNNGATIADHTKRRQVKPKRNNGGT